MSQNVSTKKIQVAARQNKIADLYLKNISVQRISEIFGVDRKTIQRDLQQIKFNFHRSMPSEEAYDFFKLVLYEYNALYDETGNLLQQSKTHEEAREYLKLLKNLWGLKSAFLIKVGIFDSIPEMLGPKHDLVKDFETYYSVKDKLKEKKKTEKQS